MTLRHTSSPIVCALAFALVAAPIFLAHAQTAAPTDASSSNAAPAAPAAPAAAPAPAPAVTPAPAAPSDTSAPAPMAPGERPTTYTVVKGDAVSSIAHKFGITWSELRKANHLKKNAILQPGQVLQIPPAKTDTTTK